MISDEDNEYSTNFHCKHYLQRFYSFTEGSSLGWMIRFRLKNLHNFFEKYNCKWDKNSAKMLEFGGGPVVMGHISAAPYVSEIVHAAYTADERREIELWKNETDGAHDWKPTFQYVVGKLESKDGDEAWQEREALVRSQFKLVSCDITQEHPIGPTEEPMPFSIICTCLVLEASCKTYTEYKASIKKLGNLLKLGGYLVMLVVENETYYKVGDHKFPVLTLTLREVKEALEEAGLVLLMTEREPVPMQYIQNPVFFDGKAFLFLAAFKEK
jgi:hypothetical protein